MENKTPDVHVRPWGRFEFLLKSPGYLVKRIELNPSSRFSLQKHFRRSETWVIVDGEGTALTGKSETPVRRGSIVQVGLGQVHRLHNTGRIPLVLVEVQLGDYLGEDDIERLADDYARG